MSTDLQNIALESLDGTLVAQNENGHLTYPMLHLDSDSVPENAQGWAPLMQGYDSVLVFVEGKVHFTDEDKIAPTTLVLCEENNFSQTIIIQTEREWSITGATFTGTVKVPSKTTVATNDGTLVATEAQVKAVADKTWIGTQAQYATATVANDTIIMIRDA